MASLPASFSALSEAGTRANRKLSINPLMPITGKTSGGALGGAGPLGFNKPRDRGRQTLDNIFDVAPVPGDPGYAPPSTPVVSPVTAMPGNDPTDLNIIAARRRSIEQQLLRRGRMSTVLTGPQQNEPLGA